MKKEFEETGAPDEKPVKTDSTTEPQEDEALLRAEEQNSTNGLPGETPPPPPNPGDNGNDTHPNPPKGI